MPKALHLLHAIQKEVSNRNKQKSNNDAEEIKLSSFQAQWKQYNFFLISEYIL